MEQKNPHLTVESATHMWREGQTDLASLCELADDEMQAAYLRGTQLMTAGLNVQALKVLESLVVLRPSVSSYVRALGFAYHRTQQMAKAYRTFSRARALDGADPISALMQAECATLALGPQVGAPLLQEALAAAKSSAKTQPYIARARRLLALCGTRPDSSAHSPKSHRAQT